MEHDLTSLCGSYCTESVSSGDTSDYFYTYSPPSSPKSVTTVFSDAHKAKRKQRDEKLYNIYCLLSKANYAKNNKTTKRKRVAHTEEFHFDDVCESLAKDVNVCLAESYVKSLLGETAKRQRIYL